MAKRAGSKSATSSPAHARKTVTAILATLDSAVGGLATLCLIGIASVTFAGVVSRYVFGASLVWTAELGQWLFIDLIFLGVPLAHLRRQHLSIGIVEQALPRVLHPALRLIVDAIVAYTTIAMTLGAQDLLSMIGGTSPALQLPGWLQYAVIPASGMLGLVAVALRDIEDGPGWWRGLAAVALGATSYLLTHETGLIPLPPASASLVMGLAFIATLALGVPVAFAMLFAVFLADAAGGVLPPPAIVQNVVRGAGQFLLLAIPLFLLAGALMNAGGLTRRLIDFADSLVRHLRGGLGQVTVVSSVMYAGISGSSNADAALAAKMLVPHMVRDGYRPPFAAAIAAAAAVLPNIIPPSVGMLIIAAATGISVGQMFIAGILPGLLYAAALMLTVHAVSGRVASAPRANWGERLRAASGAVPVLILGVVILGAIRFGIATPTEAGALAVVYALAIGLFAYRAYGLRELWATLTGTAVDSALIGLLIGVATPFGFVLATEQVPQQIVVALTSLFAAKWAMLLAVNAVLLVAGMFIDIGAAILIFAPLFLPLMTQLGVDPVHFAVIVICNLMIGGLTPPVGILAYIVSTVTNTPVTRIFAALTPFTIALIAALALITFIPAISMGLVWLIG
jgi:tripartite ATP-independent transporter DctM subunit